MAKRCNTVVNPADDTNIRVLYFDADGRKISEPTNSAGNYARQHPTPAYEVDLPEMMRHVQAVTEWMCGGDVVTAIG